MPYVGTYNIFDTWVFIQNRPKRNRAAIIAVQSKAVWCTPVGNHRKHVQCKTGPFVQSKPTYTGFLLSSP